jgi:aminoglycoside phosphotransferase (APT) family kinase protein
MIKLSKSNPCPLAPRTPELAGASILQPIAVESATLRRTASAPQLGAAAPSPPLPSLIREGAPAAADLGHMDALLHNQAWALATLRDAFAEARHIIVVAGQTGWSGMLGYRMWVDGDLYYGKAAPLHDAKRKQELAAELAITTRVAAARPGLTPAPVPATAKAGLSVTPYLKPGPADAPFGWHEAGQPPWRAAIAKQIGALHRTTCDSQSADAARVAADCVQWNADTENLYAAAQAQHGARSDFELCRTQAKAIVARLRVLPYRLALGHGDLQQGNLLVHDGNILLIDWDGSSPRDPMHNLAYFAYHIEAAQYAPEETAAFLREYLDGQPADPIAAQRFELHLARFLCNRYLQQHTGVPWKEDTAKIMAALQAWTERDACLIRSGTQGPHS